MKIAVFALLAIAATATATPQVSEYFKLADIISAVLIVSKEILPDDDILKVTGEFNLSDDLFDNATIRVNEISLSGLKSFHFTVAERDTDTHVDYTLDIKDLVVVIDVEMNLTGVLNIDQKRSIRIDLEGVKLGGNIDMNEGLTKVEDFDVLLSVADSDVKVKGFINDELSDQLGADLSKELPKVINNVGETVEELFSKFVKGVLNWFLN